MKSRKVQVTLEEPDYQALLRVAEREKKKLAAVVRESIERYCVGPESTREKHASLAALFSIDAPVIDRYEAWEREYSALKAGAETIATKPAARVDHLEHSSSGGKKRRRGGR